MRLTYRRNSQGKGGKSANRELRKDTSRIVDFHSVSLEFLFNVREDLNSMALAPGVMLVQAKEDFDPSNEEDSKFTLGIRKGETIRVLEQTEEDMWTGMIPYIGEGTFPSDLVEIKNRKNWTTSDIAEFVVKPETNKEPDGKYIFTDRIGKKYVSELECVGAYVVHARRTKFSDLVDALQLEFEGAEPGRTFFWIDIFCANQHYLTDSELREEDDNKNARTQLLTPSVRFDPNNTGTSTTLISVLHDAISRFEKCCVFFENWRQPLALRRTYCIYEMYGAAGVGKRLSVCMTPDIRSQFRDAVIHDFKETLDIFAQPVDFANSACISRSDKKFMFDAIEGMNGQPGVGFRGVEIEVELQLREWYGRFATRTLNSLKQNKVTDVALDIARLARSLGVFLIKQDLELHKQAAADALAIAIEYDRIAHGKDSVHVLEDHLLMANLLIELTHYPQAKKELEAAMKLAKNLQPEELRHDKTAETHEMFADLYDHAGKYKEAIHEYRKALHLRQMLVDEGGGDDSVMRLATCKNNLAVVLSKHEDYKEAEKMFIDAKEQIVSVVGEWHPTTAQTIHNYAKCLRRQGRYTEAREMGLVALTILEKTCGMNDPQTAKVRKAWMVDNV